MAYQNAAGINVTGIVTLSSAGVPTGSTVTQYGTVVASTNNTVASVAPSATTGVPLISQGSSANPLYGTCLIAGGGTSVTSVTTSPTATAFAGWDANKNLSANSFIGGYRTTATAAATTTLVVGDAQQQYFTGSTTQTVVMPVTSTLVLGQTYTIVNNSSGIVTVQSSGANTIQAMDANTALYLTVIDTSVTTAAGWNKEYVSQLSGDITAVGDVTSGAAFTGTQGTTLTSTTAGFSLLAASNSGGAGGNVSLTGGATSNATSAGGTATLLGGTGNTSGAGGNTVVQGGTGGATGNGGSASLLGGTAGGTSGNGGAVSILGGSSPVSGKGGAITITGGSATGSNQDATDITVTGSQGTGIGKVGKIYVLSDASGTATGTSSHSQVQRMIINGSVSEMTSGAASTIATLNDGSSTMAGGTITYTIEASDGTDFQSTSGVVAYSLVNKAASRTTNLLVLGGESSAVSAGTLTSVFSFSTNNIQVTPTTSLTATTLRITYQIVNNSQIQITVPT